MSPLPFGPVVHPWMTRSADSAHEAAGKLEVQAERLRVAVARAREALDGAAEPAAGTAQAPLSGGDGPAGQLLHGSGDSMPATESMPATQPRPAIAARPATESMPAIESLLLAVSKAQTGFGILAEALDEHGPVLRDLLRQRRELAGRPAGESGARRKSWMRHRAELSRRIRERTDALSEADAACRRAMEEATRSVPDVASVAQAGGWLRSILRPATVERLLSERSPAGAVLENPEEISRHRGWVAAGDPVAARERLLLCGPAQIRSILARHPDLAGLMAADPAGPFATAPAAELPDALAGAVDRRESSEAAGDLDAEKVTKALGAVSADDLTRWATLWPTVLGPLDGAPPACRVVANRGLIRLALEQARRDEAEFEALARAHDDLESSHWLTRVRGQARAAWLSRESLASFLMLETDHPRLLRTDRRIRIRLYQALAASSHGHRRRIVLFDPRGRGRLAELTGPWPDQARQVAVVVPGTGSAARGFHQPSQVAADLAATDPAGETCVIAWMGCEFPMALANQALLARFALAGAPGLVRFVAGLGIPVDVPVTLIGHSYGGVLVGAAERLGVRADRVMHLASAGAGPGVRSVVDYATVDASGRSRKVRRFALTAPGDPVRWATRRGPVGVVGRVPAAVDLGIDPARLEGVVVLDAGVWERDTDGHRTGDPVRGPAGHAAVTRPGTTAFRRVAEVVTGSH